RWFRGGVGLLWRGRRRLLLVRARRARQRQRAGEHPRNDPLLHLRLQRELVTVSRRPVPRPVGAHLMHALYRSTAPGAGPNRREASRVPMVQLSAISRRPSADRWEVTAIAW